MEAECWFWRILASVDDFGNMQADPSICYNLTVGNRKRLKPQNVRKWLAEMAQVGLIRFYLVRGEQFLHIEDFETTQPAGKNGKRLQRHPLMNADESWCIQVNPDSSSVSDTDTDTDTDNDNDNEDDTNTEEAQAPGLPPFSSEEFSKALADFEQHRKEIRHKLTPKARQAMYADFSEWGEMGSVLAMRRSIRNGWRGVFDPREESQNGSNQPKPNQTAAERRNAAISRNQQRAAELRSLGDERVGSILRREPGSSSR